MKCTFRPLVNPDARVRARVWYLEVKNIHFLHFEAVLPRSQGFFECIFGRFACTLVAPCIHFAALG
jgi:hypothetical protein